MKEIKCNFKSKTGTCMLTGECYAECVGIENCVLWRN